MALHRASIAVDRWFREHGTLPESLDVLDEIPTNPFTGEPVRYYVNAPPPPPLTEFCEYSNVGHINSYSVHVHFLGRDRRGTNDWTLVNKHRDAFLKRRGIEPYDIVGTPYTYLMLGHQIHLLIELPEEEEE